MIMATGEREWRWFNWAAGVHDSGVVRGLMEIACASAGEEERATEGRARAAARVEDHGVVMRRWRQGLTTVSQVVAHVRQRRGGWEGARRRK